MRTTIAALAALGLGFALAAPLVSTSAERSKGGARDAARSCSAQTFEGSRFTVCAFDPRRQSLQLAWRARDGRSIADFKRLATHLGADSPRVAFAMNAGMYEPGGAPVGLYVARATTERPLNTRDGEGSFYLKPNGVFWVDAAGAPHVDATAAYQAAAPRPRWASQSGPMLVVGGKLHPAFHHDGASHYTRNGVGVRDGRALFVISEDAVSLGRFGRFFRDVLHVREALYLDGSISSLWDPGAGRVDPAGSLGPIVVVLDGPDRDEPPRP